MTSGWSCQYDHDGACARVPGRACDPGMKGCVLFGRFRFSNPEKNRPAKRRSRVRRRNGVQKSPGNTP